MTDPGGKNQEPRTPQLDPIPALIERYRSEVSRLRALAAANNYSDHLASMLEEAADALAALTAQLREKELDGRPSTSANLRSMIAENTRQLEDNRELHQELTAIRAQLRTVTPERDARLE